MNTHSPNESTRAVRKLAGRIGGLTNAAKNDTRQTTAAARSAFKDRFIDEVDPNRELPVDERNRRAEAARKAFYARIAMKSAMSRREKSKSNKAKQAREISSA